MMQRSLLIQTSKAMHAAFIIQKQTLPIVGRVIYIKKRKLAAKSREVDI